MPRTEDGVPCHERGDGGGEQDQIPAAQKGALGR
jgi:hypothetical protein